MTLDDAIKGKPSNDVGKVPKNFSSQKPEFQEFLSTLKSFLSDRNVKDTVPRIYQCIRRGFKGNIEKWHIDEIVRELLPWKDLSRLAMRMAIEASTGRPGALVEKVIVPIRDELASRVSFPIARVRNVFDSKMKNDLEDWIAKKSSEGTLDASWVRDALICIIRVNITEEEFTIIHSIVKSCCSRKKKTSGKKDIIQPNKYENYIRHVGTLFASKQFKPSKFFLALDICEPFSNELIKTKLKLEDLNEQIQDERNELLEFKKTLNGVTQELEKVRQENRKLRQENLLKERALKDEQERFKMLDDHWKKEVVRESQGKIYAFKKYFEHEIQEARLSLDRENPNVQMALDRILHMEEYLNQIGENA